VAENIGKIQIAIEAQTADLQKGLQSAEQQVKNSANQMEKSTQGMSGTIQKSWTEMASKIGVYEQAMQVALGVVNGLKDAMVVFGEEGSSSMSKVGGSIMAFGDAGIPIVSAFIKTAEGIADIFTGASAEIAQLAKEAQERAEFLAKKVKEIAKKNTADSMEADAQRAQTSLTILRNQLSDEADLGFQFDMKRFQEREDLEKSLNDKIASVGMGAEADRMRASRDAILDLHDFETNLVAKKIAEEQALEDAKKPPVDPNIAKTSELATQLKILEAQKKGDEREAKRLAIVAKFDKMRLNATKEQLGLLNKMQEIEIGNIKIKKEDPTVEEAGTGGTTAGITTAIGSFTVAQNGQEQKKQTSILQRIAKSNEQVATEIKKSSGSGIVVAS
tara:strand:+ start:1558 stop:2724 length:1167 start_codon:yes stop_codon:yes gene_type:complete